MNATLGLSLICFISFATIAKSMDLPPIAIPGEGALISSHQIFDLANKPTKECHAATIVETSTGLVAAWFAGTRERDPDVGILVSRLENGEWTDPVEVVNGVQSSNLRYPCWNPVLFQPRKGPLMLFFKVGPHPREWWGMLTTSDDGGKTWSWPTKLGHAYTIGHLLGPVKNKPIQLEDGTILCPSSTEIEHEDGSMLWRVHFELTRDLGKSWEVIGPIQTGDQFHAIQPSILTYPEGRMQILCRSREKSIVQSWSHDHGKTWSPLTKTDLPNPNSGTDAVTLLDGRQAVIYNHSEGPVRQEDGHVLKPRRILNLAVSDDGETWKPVLTFEHETGPLPEDPDRRRHFGEYSYPAIIQTKDGLLNIVYTYNREGVKHVVVDPKKL
ncbi:MAG: sialidase family protein [Verrucomicrobiota bacterium]